MSAAPTTCRQREGHGRAGPCVQQTQQPRGAAAARPHGQSVVALPATRPRGRQPDRLHAAWRGRHGGRRGASATRPGRHLAAPGAATPAAAGEPCCPAALVAGPCPAPLTMLGVRGSSMRTGSTVRSKSYRGEEAPAIQPRASSITPGRALGPPRRRRHAPATHFSRAAAGRRCRPCLPRATRCTALQQPACPLRPCIAKGATTPLWQQAGGRVGLVEERPTSISSSPPSASSGSPSLLWLRSSSLSASSSSSPSLSSSSSSPPSSAAASAAPLLRCRRRFVPRGPAGSGSSCKHSRPLKYEDPTLSKWVGGCRGSQGSVQIVIAPAPLAWWCHRPPQCSPGSRQWLSARQAGHLRSRPAPAPPPGQREFSFVWRPQSP